MEKREIVVCCTDEMYKEKAKELANKLNLKFDIFADELEINENSEKKLFLEVGKNGISLIGDKMRMTGDFEQMSKRIKKGNLQSELLVKTVKIKNKEKIEKKENIEEIKGTENEDKIEEKDNRENTEETKKSIRVLDATAGMGEDSFLLAAAGFNVTLFEQNPIIYTLLEDALERAKKNENLCDIANRMKVLNSNSIDEMKNLKERKCEFQYVGESEGSDETEFEEFEKDENCESYKKSEKDEVNENCEKSRKDEKAEFYDVIYLDPMFPERTKSSLIKKKFQLIHYLEEPCSNEKELIEVAISAHPYKIVIKRPLKSEYLGGIKPSYSLKGNSIRYDCIVLSKG